MAEKTHQQISKELYAAYNERYEAKKLGQRENLAKAEAKIAELRNMLPPPKGTKPRWKKHAS